MNSQTTRRKWINQTMAGVAAAPYIGKAGAQTRRPNILFLMTDQHRVDCVGAYGHAAVRTPNIDRIAHEGILFRNAYTSTPTCTPARAALLTGLSPWHHGMLGYGEVAEHYKSEMPRLLRDAGYRTMMVGKTHWGTLRNGHGFHQMLLDEHCPCGNHPMLEQGVRDVTPNGFRSDYESWFWSTAPGLDPHATGLGWNDYAGRASALPEHLHDTNWTGEAATAFLKSYNRPDPFFLKVSFIRPHSPYDPPARCLKAYEGRELPGAQAGAWAERFVPRNSASPDIWHGQVPAGELRSTRAAYYGSVSFVDENIGRILDTLEARGWLDETLIFFTSDHGDMLGDQHLWRKGYGYEQAAHIPMLMRLPSGMAGAKRGLEVQNVVELRDVLPTFLDAAGVQAQTPMDGRSLLAPATGNSTGWREYIDMEHDVLYSPDVHWNGLTDGRWKYLFHARDGAEQLFHLEADPCELNDLAGDTAHTTELQRWRARLVKHFEERGAPFLVGGRLGLRPERQLYSPNYPRSA
jgi:arylsulfatase